jgi:hypothetical protein
MAAIPRNAAQTSPFRLSLEFMGEKVLPQRKVAFAIRVLSAEHITPRRPSDFNFKTRVVGRSA